MKFFEREDACGCDYCVNYMKIDNNNFYYLIPRGICKKYDILRDYNSNICDCFVLKSGVHTPKWYPGRDG